MSNFVLKSGRVIELIDNNVKSDRAISFTMVLPVVHTFGLNG